MDASILALEEKWNGFSPLGRQRPERWKESVAAFTSLMLNERGLSQRVWAARMEEAMGTADFATLFGDVVDRQMLAEFESLPTVMRQIGRQASLANFKTVRRSRGDGVVQRLQKVAVRGEYQGRKKDVDHWTYAPEKYGARIDLDWEAWLNDDMGFFDNLPRDLAQSARNTEDYLLTALFWDSAGPLDSYFDVTGTGQDGVSNLPLTIDNLATAIQAMAGASAGFRSTTGEPIMSVPRYLVVPPALQLTARAILRSVQVLNNVVSANLASVSPLADAPPLILLVNPWIPIIVTTGTLGATTWALFSGSVPPFEVGNLRGHEAPELFVKSPNAIRVGGSGLNPMDGDFDNDGMAYKVRYVQGQTVLDPRGGWASDGQ